MNFDARVWQSNSYSWEDWDEGMGRMERCKYVWWVLQDHNFIFINDGELGRVGG